MAVKLYSAIQRFMGLSTDAKPTGVPVGSTFYEENTEKNYKYTGTAWVEDFLSAKIEGVTIEVADGVFEDAATRDKQDDIIKALTSVLDADALSGEATDGTATTIEDTTMDWKVDMWKGAYVQVTVGTTTYHRLIQSNTSDTLTIATIGTDVLAESPYVIKLPVQNSSINRWGGTALTGRNITDDIAKLDIDLSALRNAIAGESPDNSTLNDLSNLIGAVTESPTQYSLLERLKVIATNLSSVQLQGNETLIQGNITLDGTTQQLTTATCRNITIQAHPDNVNYVYVGNAAGVGTSSTAHMAVLSGGSSMTFTVDNADKLYVHGTVSELVSYGGEV